MATYFIKIVDEHNNEYEPKDFTPAGLHLLISRCQALLKDLEQAEKEY